jgi:hypothetical protein
VQCTDGRTIRRNAFLHQDGHQIPLVWQHQHDEPGNVLGYLVLHHADDGVRADGFFNDTKNGQDAKKLVIHKDIKHLSIYANQLVEKAKNVIHGMIREGSLVLAGANPGAFIDNIAIQHGDGTLEDVADEAIIHSGVEIEIELQHATSQTIEPPKQVPMSQDPDQAADDAEDVAEENLTLDSSTEDFLASLTDVQKDWVYGLLGSVSAQHTDSVTPVEPDPATPSPAADPIISDQKGDLEVTHRNVFDQTQDDSKTVGHVLSHSDVKEIIADATKNGSLKDAVDAFALKHGIDDISTLFPYDKAVTETPDFIARRMEWVNGVLTSVRKTPFARIRSWTADITIEEARAKGYVKGNLKREEFFRIARRITTPQTVYKKQKLDRDDMLDITDFDVVTWLQTEMRLMLDEELARAILIGDGRDVADPDKIDPTHVRPILGDDDMYVTVVDVSSTTINANAQGPDAIVDAIVNGMVFYRGSGNPVFYTTLQWLAKMLLAKDTLGRRLYATKADLAAALTVSDIIPCEVLDESANLIGIVVNLTDYTIGMDKGGQVSMFDFFDIDFNAFKYLMETRLSGAMTKYKGALVVMATSGTLAGPATDVTFDDTTGIATVPTVPNVTYYTVDDTTGVETSVSSGAQTAIASGAYVHYRAKANSSYYLADGDVDWTFRRD